MKLIPAFLIAGMLAVSGWAEENEFELYSPELVKKAQAGNANAQYNLGVLYDTGVGVSKDEKEAVKWYTKSAEQGFARAQSFLGVCYYKGKGVEKDEKESVKWLTKGAAQGDADAKEALEELKSK